MSERNGLLAFQPDSDQEEDDSLKGHPPCRRSTRHRLDWLEHDGRLSPRRHHHRIHPAKATTRQHHTQSSLNYWSKIRWMLAGTLLGSLLTQLLQVITISSTINVDNVGLHEAIAFGQPFAKNLNQPIAAAAGRNLQVENSQQKHKVPPPLLPPPAPLSIDTNANEKTKQLVRNNGPVLLSKNAPPAQRKEDSNIRSSDSDTTKDDQQKDKIQQVPEYIAKNLDSVFVDLPPPPKLEKDDYVSACLLIKDDNHWLIEWLAYHYFALPLKELIVAVDPDSKTSPKKIFHRWTSRNLMNITIWEDKDIMPKKIQAKATYFDNNTQVMMHRVRQTNFIKKCVPALRKNHAKWALLIDTDEFVLPSYASWYFLNVTHQIPHTEPGNVLKMLKYHESLTSTTNNHTCVYMPRFFFGAKESSPQSIRQFMPIGLKDQIDPRNLLTQRFLYRDPRQNPNGKNLINLRRVPKIQQFESVHKITSVCPDLREMWNINQQHHAIVRIHHYLGTKEQHFFRDDPRTHNNGKGIANGKQQQASTPDKKKATKQPETYIVRGMERYDKLNASANHKDDGMMGWVVGFVRQVGKKTALELLKGVGEVGVE